MGYLRHMTPSVYELELSPSLVTMTTEGWLSLHFAFDGDDDSFYDNKIVLNSRGIQIEEGAVAVANVDLDSPSSSSSSRRSVSVSGHGYDFDRDLYVVHLSEDMDPSAFLNEYTLDLHFYSAISDRPVEGLFRFLHNLLVMFFFLQ